MKPADTRRHGRRLPPEAVDRIGALVFQGHQVPQVQAILERELGDLAPDIRTTRRHVRRVQEQYLAIKRRLGDNTLWDLTGPLDAGEASAVGIVSDQDQTAPEVATDLLPVLRAALAAGHPWPTAEAVRWWAWVRHLAPDLAGADVPTLAATWRLRRVTGRPTRDLVLFVATAPWRGRRAFDAYLDALVRWPLPDLPALYPWWDAYPRVAGAWLVAVAVRLAWLVSTLCAEVAARAGRGETTTPGELRSSRRGSPVPETSFRPAWVPGPGTWRGDGGGGGFDWHGISVEGAVRWLAESLAWYHPRLACLRRAAQAFLPRSAEAGGDGGSGAAAPARGRGESGADADTDAAVPDVPPSVGVEPPPDPGAETDRLVWVHRLFHAAAASVEAVLRATQRWVTWVTDWQAGHAEEPPFPWRKGDVGLPWKPRGGGFPSAESAEQIATTVAAVPDFPGESLAPEDVWRAVVESVTVLRRVAPLSEEVAAVPFPFTAGMPKVPFPSPGGMDLPGRPE